MISVWRLLAFGLLTFLALFVVLLPMKSALRFVDAPAALSYGNVDGSIWSSQFEQSSWLGKPLGTVRFSPEITPLLWGELRGRADLSGSRYRGSVYLVYSDVLILQNLALQAPVSGSVGQLPVSGDVSLLDARFVFDVNGRCTEASGSLSTNAFAPFISALGDRRQELSALVFCEGGVPVITFNHDTDLATIEAIGRLTGGSEVSFDVTLRFLQQPAMPAQQADWLSRSGFQETGGVWRSTMKVSL